MAFVPHTKIYTEKGWKLISEISGKDKVLVRNFIGDAEFIQPFALKKRHYEGEVITMGNTYWATTVTPEHRVTYVRETIPASEVVPHKGKDLHRVFKFLGEKKGTVRLNLYDKNGTRSVILSHEDWYTILAYAVTRGFITKERNPRIKFMVPIEKAEPLIAILNNFGITWSYEDKEVTGVVTVNRDNNLARKVKRTLGARARRDMQIPDSIIFGSTQTLAKHFIKIYLSIVAKPGKKRPNQQSFTTRNPKLLESLRTLAMIVGYGFSVSETHGEYICYILPRRVSPWCVVFVEKKQYSGDVYELDLFEGSVYVTEGRLPVWMGPK